MANVKKVFRDLVIKTGDDVSSDLTDFIRALSRSSFVKVHRDGADGMTFTIPIYIGDVRAAEDALRKQGFEVRVSDEAVTLEIEQAQDDGTPHHEDDPNPKEAHIIGPHNARIDSF